MIRNTVGQTIGAQMVSATTGAAFAGSVSVFVDVDAQGQAAGQSAAPVLAGNGYYTYFPTAPETNGNLIAFTFIGTGAVPVTVQVATVTPSQQSALATATGGLSTPVATIINDAFREIAVYTPVMPIPPDDFAFGLGKLNRFFDAVTNDRRYTFSQSFTPYPITPNHQPHTIGPNAADWSVTQRPIEIRHASLILTDVTPNVYIPVDVRPWSWWADIPVKAVTSSVPTTLYYQPDWPNGSVYLWPVPTVAYQLEIVTRVGFALVGATDTFWLPPGYRDLITLQLAQTLAPAYPGAIVSPLLKAQLRELTGQIFNMAADIPDLDLVDAGMPGGALHPVNTLNYRSRTPGS